MSSQRRRTAFGTGVPFEESLGAGLPFGKSLGNAGLPFAGFSRTGFRFRQSLGRKG